LKKSRDDIKSLLRFRSDNVTAEVVSDFLDGNSYYLALDGTMSQELQIDVLVFYIGSFGYKGKLNSDKGNITAEYPTRLDEPLSISTAIPLYDEDVPMIAGEVTEGGIEVDFQKLPTNLMQLSEYYLALKTVINNPEIKTVILDRSISGDMSHLVWSTADHIQKGSMVLLGRKTSEGIVERFDLELARMLIPNNDLNIPPPRSHLLKYAAIFRLMENEGCTVEEIIEKLGANKLRTEKLKRSFKDWKSEHRIFEKETSKYQVRGEVSKYWNRVIEATMGLVEHIFSEQPSGHSLRIKINEQEKWITSIDIECLSLFLIYELIRRSWKNKILLIGLTKDSNARELVKTVIPILKNAGLINLSKQLPNFNSDKMLLQTNSIINCRDITTPWRTFEYDVSFRTMAPISDLKMGKGEARILGAFKNVVSVERLFVKAYVQLWSSRTNPQVRSHIFLYDRLCHPEYDKGGELILHHKDGVIEERIEPLLHFKKDSEIGNLVMNILQSMSNEVIPEALGHNYPLFLADKKAKIIGKQIKKAYLGALAVEMSRNRMDQQIVFSGRFRDYRSSIEAERSS
jgi:hypothetical protein